MNIDVQKNVVNLYLYLGQLERNIVLLEQQLDQMRIDKQTTLNTILQLEGMIDAPEQTVEPPAPDSEK